MRDAKAKSDTSMTESIRISWSHERLPDCQNIVNSHNLYTLPSQGQSPANGSRCPIRLLIPDHLANECLSRMAN